MAGEHSAKNGKIMEMYLAGKHSAKNGKIMEMYLAGENGKSKMYLAGENGKSKIMDNEVFEFLQKNKITIVG